MVYLIPISCFLVHALVGFWGARRGFIRRVLFYSGALGAVMIWTFWKGENAQGWDGLGYFITAMFFMAPGVGGALIGGAFGWWKHRKSLAD